MGRDQASTGQEGPRERRYHRHRGGEEGWCLHAARTLQDQDSCQASDQGWQKGDLRQNADGQGQAGEDNCEGLPRRRLEGKLLSELLDISLRYAAPWGIPRMQI